MASPTSLSPKTKDMAVQDASNSVQPTELVNGPSNAGETSGSSRETAQNASESAAQSNLKPDLSAGSESQTDARKDSGPQIDLTKDTPHPTTNEQGTKRTHEEFAGAPGSDDHDVDFGKLAPTDSADHARPDCRR